MCSLTEKIKKENRCTMYEFYSAVLVLPGLLWRQKSNDWMLWACMWDLIHVASTTGLHATFLFGISLARKFYQWCIGFWFHFLTPITCSISVPMFDSQCFSILHSVDSSSLSVLFFPCTNTAIWHPIICYFGIEPNFQLFCMIFLLPLSPTAHRLVML
jgi:hypothetical protein